MTHHPLQCSASPNEHRFSKTTLLAFLGYLAFLASFVALQTLSLWNYQGDKVDETELVHYAVGFLGGNLDPGWYIYGPVGMYVLAAAYYIVGLVQVTLGIAPSLLDYASRAFDSGFFILFGRAIFAALGALTVLLYARLGRRTGLTTPFVLLFVLASLFGPDGLFFANYIRCDQIVALITAIMFLVVASTYSASKKLAILSCLVAVSVAAKTSSLPIAIIPGLYWLFELSSWKERSRLALWCTLLFLVVFHLLSPFSTLWDQVVYAAQTGMMESRVTFSKRGYFGFYEHHTVILQILQRFLGSFSYYAILFAPFALLQLGSLRVYVIAAAFALISPYYFGTEVADYWFLPVFFLFRFLGIMGIFVVVNRMARVVPYRAEILSSAVAVVCFALITFEGLDRYSAHVSATLTGESNITTARKWLEANASESSPILIDGHYDYVMPKFYGTQDVAASKAISRAFIYNRAKNPYLNAAFEHFYVKRHQPRFEGRKLEAHRILAANPTTEAATLMKRVGGLFVTSPLVYNRFLLNTRSDLNSKQKEALVTYQAYYRLMTSQPLVAAFTEGSGPQIEIYRLEKLAAISPQ
jgi:hypothetical protein